MITTGMAVSIVNYGTRSCFIGHVSQKSWPQFEWIKLVLGIKAFFVSRVSENKDLVA